MQFVQMWNSGDLLLGLGMIVLSIENDFQRPQKLIVLMKQTYKKYTCQTEKKTAASGLHMIHSK